QTYTQDVHPDLAERIYGTLVDNPGDQFGGKVVDLGNGRMGFASTAGSLVVAPRADGEGWKVSYTVQTNMIAQAMQGGEQPPEEPGAGGAPVAPDDPQGPLPGDAQAEP